MKNSDKWEHFVEKAKKNESEPIDENGEKKNPIWYEILDWAKYILAAVLIGFLLTNYVIQRNEVVGESMYPTLMDEDQLWVEKISPVFGRITRGDIITFSVHDPELGPVADEDLVKRVIATPGDHLEIRDDGIYLNGEALAEDYLIDGMQTYASIHPEYNDIVLEDQMFFVMGDNRMNSRDSRSFGPIHADDIIGEVWVRLYPFSRFGTP